MKMTTLKYYKQCAIVAAVTLACSSWAQEQAHVISSTPVYQSVTVTQQICGTSPMVVNQPKSGAGAVMGAIAGGAIGNSLGHGAGNAADTAIGVMSGAIMGDRLESQPATVQNVQTCSPQASQQNKLAYYNVKYEFAGKQYDVQMPNDPGPVITVSVTPQVNGNNTIPTSSAVGAAPVMSQTTVVPAQVYAAPSIYPYGYPYSYGPSPISMSFGFGYYGGFRHR
jgi:uncharacterized protein YcfJ